jgi:predicted type IV restriction endonuclease
VEINTIDQIIQAIKGWLNNPSNDRLSVQQIFEGYDR